MFYDKFRYVLEIDRGECYYPCTLSMIYNVFNTSMDNIAKDFKFNIALIYIVFENREEAEKCVKILNAKLFLMKRMTI